MSYDYDYYSGRDLVYPRQPSRPRLDAKKTITSSDALRYAAELAEYEEEHIKFVASRNAYNEESNKRQGELMRKLEDDYDISPNQFRILWRRAWDDGHSEGLRRVVEMFEEYYELATEFAAAEG
jgi:hypothetical protein